MNETGCSALSPIYLHDGLVDAGVLPARQDGHPHVLVGRLLQLADDLGNLLVGPVQTNSGKLLANELGQLFSPITNAFCPPT